MKIVQIFRYLFAPGAEKYAPTRIVIVFAAIFSSGLLIKQETSKQFHQTLAKLKINL